MEMELPAAVVICFSVLHLTLPGVRALDNGLALTPPMGWLTWERYRCTTNCRDFPDDCISEKLMKTTADLLKSGGYLEAGYDTIIIDDCWSEKKRDPSGRLVPDKSRFPSGIKSLSNYVHGKGLKFGIYANFGNYTCAGYPGTMNYQKLDATTFAEWDVDYVKLDGCYSTEADRDEGYPSFSKHLNNTGRLMVYSCSWPAYASHSVYDKLPTYCNLWRNYADIEDSWNSVLDIIDHFNKYSRIYTGAAGPGHWNDPDMLIIGNFGLSEEQSKAQMAIWSIFAAPLIMSNDLRNMPSWAADILLNKDIIAVDQDPLGIMGELVKQTGHIDIYLRKISPHSQGQYSYACVFLNRAVGGAKTRIKFTPSQLGLTADGGYIVKDLFTGESLGHYSPTDSMKADVAPSGVVMYRFNIAIGYHSQNEISVITVQNFDESSGYKAITNKKKPSWSWKTVLY